jgi:hypothetical protein
VEEDDEGDEDEKICDDDEEEKTYTKIFDTATKSNVLNLTEFWLEKFKANLCEEKINSVGEYLRCVDQIVPISIAWAQEPFAFKAPSSTHKDLELLFVAFKSNEVACFIVHSGIQVLEIK